MSSSSRHRSSEQVTVTRPSLGHVLGGSHARTKRIEALEVEAHAGGVGLGEGGRREDRYVPVGLLLIAVLVGERVDDAEEEALAEHLQVAPEQLTLGNGSNDVLVLLAETFLTPSGPFEVKNALPSFTPPTAPWHGERSHFTPQVARGGQNS